MFLIENERLIYNARVCVQRNSVSTFRIVLTTREMMYISNFAKTMSRLINYHWIPKKRDIKNFVSRCFKGQQYKNSGSRTLKTPEPLKVPKRCGSLTTDFIVGLPNTKDGYDSISTWADRLSSRVHFIKLKGPDKAVSVANSFFKYISKPHGLLDIIVSDPDSKVRSTFCVLYGADGKKWSETEDVTASAPIEK